MLFSDLLGSRRCPCFRSASCGQRATVSSMNTWSCQDFPGRKPACSSDMIECASISVCMRFLVILSSILYQRFSRDMGRCWSACLTGGDVFGMSSTMAYFSFPGTVQDFHMVWISCVVMSIPISPAPMSNSIVMLSGPLALRFCMDLMTLATSFLVGGFSIGAMGMLKFSSSW